MPFSETLPIRSELYTPANKVSAWVGKKEDNVPRDASKEYQGVWVVEGYTIDKKKALSEVWIFRDNDEEGIDRRVLENNPLRGTWGYAPNVDPREAGPGDLWFFPPESARCKIPPHLQNKKKNKNNDNDDDNDNDNDNDNYTSYNHKGTWIKPVYKRDYSSLGKNASGFIDVSGNVPKGEKHSVAGQWKMIGFNDDVVRGKKKKTDHKDPNKGPWTVYVRKPSGTTFPLPSAIPGNRISRCKEKILKAKGIPIDEQRLSFQKVPLRDEKTLVGSGVRNGDTIDLGPMVVGVRTRKGKVFTFEVDPDETVETLKRRVEKRQGTPPADEQRLYFKGTKLTDGKPLTEFGIQHNARIDLGVVIIYVQPLGDRPRVELEVEPTDTLHSVRVKVKNRTQIPVADQRLSFNDQELLGDPNTNTNTLEDYKIQHLDTLFMIEDDPSNNTNTTPPPTPPTTTTTTSSSESTDPSIPEDAADPAAKPAPNTRSRGDPENPANTTTTTTTTTTTEMMMIYIIKEWNQKKFKFEVEPTNTILDLKKRMEVSGRIPVKEQLLTFKKKPVDDTKTLEQSNIQHKNVLYLSKPTTTTTKVPNTNNNTTTTNNSPKTTKPRKIKLPTTVEIELPTRKKIKIPVTPLSTISDIKDHIETIKSIPKSNQRIYFLDNNNDDNNNNNNNSDDDDKPRALDDTARVQTDPSNKTIPPPLKLTTDPLGIVLKTPDGRSFWLDVDPDNNDTPGDLKRKAAETVVLPIGDLHLIDEDGNLVLEDGDDGDLPKPGSVLTVAPLLDVVAPDKSRVKIPLLPHTTFDDVRDTVIQKTGSPPPEAKEKANQQRIFFLDPDGDEIVDESVPLEKAGILPGSVLEMRSVPRGEGDDDDGGGITVKSPDGRCFRLGVDPETDTVKDLKRRAAKTVGLPVKDLYLLDDDGEVVDVGDDMPKAGSALDVAPLIEVVTPGMQTKVKVPLLPQMRFKDIKDFVTEKTGSPPNPNTRVFFFDPDGDEIDYDTPMEKAGIKPGSLLEMRSVPLENDIVVRSPDGRCLYFNMDRKKDTVKDLKRKTAKTVGLPVRDLYLLDDDEKILSDGDDMPRPWSVLDVAPLIQVATPDKKTKVKVPLLPYMEFEDIKDIVTEITGSPPEANKRVFFLDPNGNEIDDSVPVDKAGIEPGSLLEMCSVPLEINNITVRSPDGRCFYFDMDPETDTVEDLKRKAAKTVGLPVKDLYLVDGGEVVDVGNNLPKAGSVLDVAPLIEVTTPDKTKVKVPLLPQMKFEDIKDIVTEITGSPPEANKRVFFLDNDGNEIDDSVPVDKAGIEPGSLLEMCSVPIEDNNITVRSPDGRCFHFDMDPKKDTVEDLKRKVAKVVELPVKDLYLVDDGEVVDVGNDLPKAGSVLDVAPLIEVTTPDKTTVKVPLLPQMKFDDIKDIVTEKTGSPPDANNRVFFLDSDGNEVDDSVPVDKAGIEPGSLLEMCSVPIEDNNITVRSPDGRCFHFDMDPKKDTVEDLKRKVAKVVELPVKDLYLVDDGEVIDVGNDLPKAGSVLDVAPLIEVTTPDKTKVKVPLLPQMKFDDIKDIVTEKTGSPPDANNRVFFLDSDGNEVDDSVPVDKAGIKPGSLLEMCSVPLGINNITVRSPDGRCFHFDMDPEKDTVEDLKRKVATAVGLPIKDFDLVGDEDKILDVGDDMPKTGSALDIVPFIDITMPDKSKVKVPLLPQMHFGDIKDFVTEGSSPQANKRVFFLDSEGNEMDDDTPMDEAGIKPGATLEMRLVPVNKGNDISVRAPDGRCFHFDMDPEKGTVEDLKRKAATAVGLPIKDFDLVDDDDKIVDVGDDMPKTGSALDIVPFIDITMPNKSKVKVPLLPQMHFGDIKDFVTEGSSPQANKRVFFLDSEGNEMDDDTPMDEAGIKPGATLEMRLVPLDKGNDITVRSPDGRCFSFDMDPETDTMKDLEKKLAKTVGLPVKDLYLVDEDGEIVDTDDNDSAPWVGSALDVAPLIDVTMPDKSKVKFPLLPGMQFGDIKDIVEEKSGVSTKENQRVFFLDSEGNEMDDNTPMDEAGIKPGATLEMRSVPLDDSNDITVRSPDGRCFHFDVDPETDTVEDLKRKAAKTVGLPVKDLYLIDDDGEIVDIDDNDSVPRAGSVLDVAPLIDVTMPDNTKVKVPLLPYMKFEDVKDIVEEKVGSPQANAKSRIFFLDSEGNEMGDNTPVEKAVIKPGKSLKMCSVPFEENTVTVRSPDGRCFHFDFDPENDTVKDLKARIANHFGVPVKELPSLLLDELMLDDDYRPPRGSILDFDPIAIKVELPNRDEIFVATTPMQTIREIKDIIAEKTGVKSSDQRIFFLDDDAEEIDNDTTLSAAKVKADTPLKIFSGMERKEPKEIEVKDHSGRTFQLFIDPDESVQQVKERVSEKIGFPIGGFKLDDKEWNGIDEDIPLEEAGFTVRCGGVLEVYPPEVEIELPNSKKMKMKLLPTMTIQDVQELVKEEALDLSISDIKQRMFFLDGIDDLDDDTPFEKLKFEKGYKLEKQSIVINIEYWKGDDLKHLSISVQNDWYMDDLREQFFRLTNIPPDQQNFKFNGEPVKEDLQLTKQGIAQDSTLTLVPMSILIKIPHRKDPVRFIVKPTHTIEKVKRRAFKRIKEEKKDSSDDYCLVTGGRELGNKESLEENGIRRDDVLTLEEFKLRIMHWSGQIFDLDDVRRNETIFSLKERILKKKAISIDDQRLSLDGKRLNDENTIEKEQIKHRTILVLEPLDDKTEVPKAEKKTLKTMKSKRFKERSDDVEIMPVMSDWEKREFFFDDDDTFDAHIELVIMHWTGETFTLSNILLRTKVGEIKNKILRARGIAKKKQTIKLEDKILDDTKTLLEQNVNHRSILVLEAPVKKNAIVTPSVERISGIQTFSAVPKLLQTRINITVMHWNGDEFNLSPSPNDYIDDVKDAIHDLQNIPLEQIRLSFQGEPTQISCNLKEQGIIDGSVLDLEPMRLLLEFPGRNEPVCINVEMDQRIYDVKKIVANMSNLSLASICIMSGSEELDSSKTISDYEIHHDDTLEVEMYQVKVMHFFGEVFSIDKVNAASTPRDVKEQLSTLMSFDIDEQVLCLNGMALNDMLSLCHQGVRHKSVLILQLPEVKNPSPVKEKAPFSFFDKSLVDYVAKTSKDTLIPSLSITIQHWNGDTFSVDAKPTEYVDDLKERIFSSKKIPINEQRLEFEGQPVCDIKCIKEQGILNNSTLILRQMVVNICISDEDRTLAVEADPKDSVLQLKKRFQIQTKIPLECQCLVLGGEELADAKKLSHYRIEDGETLELEEFAIKVLDWNGNVFEVTGINSGSTVEELKARIQIFNAVPPDEQVLKANKMPVLDNMRLKDQQIKHKSILSLTLAPKTDKTRASPPLLDLGDKNWSRKMAGKAGESRSCDGTSSISTADSQPSEGSDPFKENNKRKSKSPKRRTGTAVPMSISSIAERPSSKARKSSKSPKRGKEKSDALDGESAPKKERSSSKTRKSSKSPKREKETSVKAKREKSPKAKREKSPKRKNEKTDKRTKEAVQ